MLTVHIWRQESVCPNHDINVTILEIFQDLLHFLGCRQASQYVYFDSERLESLFAGLEMFIGKDDERGEEKCLLGVEK